MFSNFDRFLRKKISLGFYEFQNQGIGTSIVLDIHPLVAEIDGQPVGYADIQTSLLQAKMEELDSQ